MVSTTRDSGDMDSVTPQFLKEKTVSCSGISRTRGTLRSSPILNFTTITQYPVSSAGSNAASIESRYRPAVAFSKPTEQAASTGEDHKIRKEGRLARSKLRNEGRSFEFGTRCLPRRNCGRSGLAWSAALHDEPALTAPPPPTWGSKSQGLSR